MTDRDSSRSSQVDEMMGKDSRKLKGMGKVAAPSWLRPGQLGMAQRGQDSPARWRHDADAENTNVRQFTV